MKITDVVLTPKEVEELQNITNEIEHWMPPKTDGIRRPQNVHLARLKADHNLSQTAILMFFPEYNLHVFGIPSEEDYLT